MSASRAPSGPMGAFLKDLATGVRSFMAHHRPTAAAAMAFYTSLSFGPAVVLMLTVTSSLGEGIQTAFVRQISDLMGPHAGEVIGRVVETAGSPSAERGLGTALSIAILAVSATGVFAQLQATLNRVWEVQPKAGLALTSWIRRRVLSFGILLAIAFILGVSLVFNVIVSAVFSTDGPLWHLVDFVASSALFTVLFGLMYWFLPDAQVRRKSVWVGAAVGGVMFSAAKYAIGLYLGNSSVATAYAAAGSIIVLLVWAFVSAAVFLFGAEVVRARTLRVEAILPPPDPEVAEPETDPRE